MDTLSIHIYIYKAILNFSDENKFFIIEFINSIIHSTVVL